jgi:acylpyruvate hydrolase
MRLQTIRHGNHRTQAVLETDRGLLPLPAADIGELVRDPHWRRIVADLAQIATEKQYLEVGTVDCAAVVTTPRKVICCGHNYRAHIAEMGRPVPDHPTLFAKFADTLTGPYDPVVLPAVARQVDWEAELAIIIGAECVEVTHAQAGERIAGYAIANDISIRDWQRRTTQWFQGKAFDATTPLGPGMVTADEFAPDAGMKITCEVNGDRVQIGSTDDLLFGPAHLVSYISQFTALLPGDVVLTGTPGGVGMAANPPRYLAEGDVVAVEVEGLGQLQNTIEFRQNPTKKESVEHVEH